MKRLSLVLLAMFAVLISANAAEKVAIPFGKRTVTFHVEKSPKQGRGPMLISLHSNEKTSLTAARKLLSEYAGTIVAIDGGGSRRIPLYANSKRVTLDPNRAFSLAGVTRDLNRFSIFSKRDAELCAQFGKAIVETFRISQATPIIALHNNTNGGYSISSYEAGGSEASAAAKVHRGKGDSDDFYLVTHEKLFESLKKANYNVVLQDNLNAPEDGSLSVFCGRRGITYVNVETEHGKLDRQKTMLEDLLRIIGN